MNGVHDMGGMDGMGPIIYEQNEPVFHAEWEARVYALTLRIGRWGRGRNWASGRFQLESIPPAEYLRMSYYERWFKRLVDRMVGSDLVTRKELEAGKADPDRPLPQLLPEPSNAFTSERLDDVNAPPRFRPEQRVRARNLHPRGHTRLPRYVRGRLGTVIRDHGVFNLQDTDENGQRPAGDYRPQHVYTVRFASVELWGDRGLANDSVYLDLWEDYLEPA